MNSEEAGSTTTSTSAPRFTSPDSIVTNKSPVSFPPWNETAEVETKQKNNTSVARWKRILVIPRLPDGASRKGVGSYRRQRAQRKAKQRVEASGRCSALDVSQH